VGCKAEIRTIGLPDVLSDTRLYYYQKVFTESPETDYQYD